MTEKSPPIDYDAPDAMEVVVRPRAFNGVAFVPGKSDVIDDIRRVRDTVLAYLPPSLQRERVIVKLDEAILWARECPEEPPPAK